MAESVEVKVSGTLTTEVVPPPSDGLESQGRRDEYVKEYTQQLEQVISKAQTPFLLVMTWSFLWAAGLFINEYGHAVVLQNRTDADLLKARQSDRVLQGQSASWSAADGGDESVTMTVEGLSAEQLKKVMECAHAKVPATGALELPVDAGEVLWRLYDPCCARGKAAHDVKDHAACISDLKVLAGPKDLLEPTLADGSEKTRSDGSAVVVTPDEAKGIAHFNAANALYRQVDPCRGIQVQRYFKAMNEPSPPAELTAFDHAARHPACIKALESLQDIETKDRFGGWSFELPGLKVRSVIHDWGVLGSAGLSLLLAWLYFASRRENHALRAAVADTTEEHERDGDLLGRAVIILRGGGRTELSGRDLWRLHRLVSQRFLLLTSRQTRVLAFGTVVLFMFPALVAGWNLFTDIRDVDAHQLKDISTWRLLAHYLFPVIVLWLSVRVMNEQKETSVLLNAWYLAAGVWKDQRKPSDVIVSLASQTAFLPAQQTEASGNLRLTPLERLVCSASSQSLLAGTNEFIEATAKAGRERRDGWTFGDDPLRKAEAAKNALRDRKKKLEEAENALEGVPKDQRASREGARVTAEKDVTDAANHVETVANGLKDSAWPPVLVAMGFVLTLITYKWWGAASYAMALTPVAFRFLLLAFAPGTGPLAPRYQFGLSTLLLLPAAWIAVRMFSVLGPADQKWLDSSRTLAKGNLDARWVLLLIGAAAAGALACFIVQAFVVPQGARLLKKMDQKWWGEAK